ncbi:MAG: amidohydrolase [Propionibacteriaceae bacterium]
MTATVLQNCRLLGQPGTTDIAIVDGVITDAPPAQAELIDVDGRYLMPGLWDQHAHLSQWAITTRRLPLADAASAAEAAARCADAMTGDEPLIGCGFHDALWPDLPTTALLDQYCGEHPVVIVAGDLHCCWANSAALRRFTMPHYDDVLREEPAFELQRRISAFSDETLDLWVSEAADAAAALGIVGIVDMEMSWNQTPWQRRMAAGFQQFRVRASIYPQHLERAIAEGLRSGATTPDFPLLEVGPFKIITDGSLNTRTACCFDTYPDSDSFGAMSFSTEQIHEYLTLAAAHDIWCAVHAIGDAANSAVLDAFAATGARGRVEHAQLLADADLPRFAELGITASVQPQHLLDDRYVADRIWPGRTQRTYRFGDLYRAGATLEFGSDAPVAALNPWHAIQAGAERRFADSDPWHSEQCLPLDVCLAASTNHRGLVPQLGAPADLIVLDVDPRQLHGNQLRELTTAATMVAGRFTHQSW